MMMNIKHLSYGFLGSVLFFCLISSIAGCSSKTATALVQNYGAKGNGKSDDSKAIQKAINEATDVVRLEPKTYLITSALKFKSNIVFDGNGASLVIPEGKVMNGIEIRSVSNVVIKDLTMIGQMAKVEKNDTGRNRNLISCKNSNQLYFENITIQEHNHTTTHFTDCSGITISNCIFQNIGKDTSWEDFLAYSYDAVYIGGYTKTSDIKIKNCVFKNIGSSPIKKELKNDADAIHLSSPKSGVISNVSITECTFDYCAARGVKLQSGDGYVIDNNKFSYCNSGVGMTMANAVSDIVITNNEFSNVNIVTSTNHKGLAATDVLIEGNNVSDCSFFYRTSGGSVLKHSSILNNEVKNVKSCFIDGVAEYLEVKGNTITNYGYGEHRSYHMAILFSGNSNNLTVSNNTFNQATSTTTAIYFGKGAQKIVAEANQINVPKGNNKNYLIIDHSKNLKRSGSNKIIEKY